MCGYAYNVCEYVRIICGCACMNMSVYAFVMCVRILSCTPIKVMQLQWNLALRSPSKAVSSLVAVRRRGPKNFANTR